MCNDMTLEGYDGDRILLSYDVSGGARPVAARVCQLVFGRRRISEGATRTAYREKGFIHRPGVVWIGQSVLLMPPRDAATCRDACFGSECEWPPLPCRSFVKAWRPSAGVRGSPA